MSIAALPLLAAIVATSPTVSRAPSMVCAALHSEGFEGVAGPPRWIDYGAGEHGCAAQIQVGMPDGRTLLASAVQFSAVSTDKSVVQRVELSASMLNPRSKALTLKRLRHVAETLFRAMSLDLPDRVLAAIEEPRSAAVRMPYGTVKFAQINDLKIEEWMLTVTIDGDGKDAAP